MNRVKIAAAVGAASLALVTTSCGLLEGGGSSGASDSLEEMSPITLNVNGIGAPGDQNMQALQSFADQVDKDTDGKIKFDVYEPNALLPTPEALKGTGAGVADLAVIVGVSSPNELPVTVWLSTLASTLDKAFSAGTLQGGAAINELARSSEEIQAEYEKQNVHILNSNLYGQQFDFLCHEPLTDLASAKGLRTRTSGPVWSELTVKLGMEPVQLASADTFEALQRKVIDCEISPPEAHVTVGGMEIAKHYTPVPLTGNMGGYTLVMNKDVWDDLPDEAQNIIDDAAADHWANLTQGQIEAPLQFVENAEKYDTVFHEPSADLLAAVQKGQEEAIAAMVESAPEGVSDPEALIAEFELLAAKWLEKVPDEAFVNKDAPVSADTYRTAAEIDYSDFYDSVRASFE